MNRSILVTGATGNVGQHVVRALVAKGARVRAAARDAGSVAAMHGAVDATALDLTDSTTWRQALEGVSRVFLLRPPSVANTKQTLNPFIDLAIKLGVDHVTFVSVAGAEGSRVIPHAAVERHLASASVGSTILRPGFFAQNLGDAYRLDLLEDDRLYVPAGDGVVAWVDVRDVAEVAAASLCAPAEHDGRAYTLTGPVAVSLEAVAAALSLALERPIRYRAASILGYARHLRRRGMPWMQILVQTVLHVGLRFGQAADVDPTLGSLLDHPPRTVFDYIADHRALWQPRMATSRATVQLAAIAS